MINQIKTARVIFVSAIILILLLAVLSYSRLNALVESSELVNHTTKVTLELERTIGCLIDAETGYRGFLITHDTHFLEPYNKGLNEYPEHLKILQQLTKDNPVQERNLLMLDDMGRHRQAYMRKILEVDKLHAPTAVEMLMGKAIMDSLRTQVNKMIKVEQDLMQQRQEQLKKQTFLAPAMILILGITALVILLIAYRQIKRYLIASQQLKDEIIKQNIEIEKNRELQSIATNEAIAKKQIEESEKQYRELADTLPQLVWRTDAAGNQTYASSRWKEFTGLDPKDADTFQQMLHPDDLEGITKT